MNIPEILETLASEAKQGAISKRSGGVPKYSKMLTLLKSAVDLDSEANSANLSRSSGGEKMSAADFMLNDCKDPNARVVVP